MNKRDSAPTYNQIQLIFRWFDWCMPTAEASDATHWAEKNRTKQQTSMEIDRLMKLRDEHKLTREMCFGSKYWADYKPKLEKE